MYEWARDQRYQAELGVPGLEQLGRYRHADAQAGLPTHAHEGCAEICLLASGRQRYRVNGQAYMLRGGNQFVTLPGEPHDTDGQPEERGVLYWVLVSLDTDLPRWLFLEPGAASVLQDGIRTVPIRQFAARSGSVDLLERALSVLTPDAEPFARLEGAAMIVQFLLDTVRAARESSSEPRPVVERAQRYVMDNLDRPLSVRELAAVVDTSTPHLHAIFRTDVGMPPGEYMLRLRIDRACDLLIGSSMSVSEISHQVGFSSSQHFATTFRRFTRQTPTGYRRSRGPA